jgi:hypothetical protein
MIVGENKSTTTKMSKSFRSNNLVVIEMSGEKKTRKEDEYY